ncbi:MAG: hypothetical protein M0Q01_04580 [Syntrophales bacterium]|jgi:hypothetical protein|nr:hypothetical protein [Syntrophales bacterium]
MSGAVQQDQGRVKPVYLKSGILGNVDNPFSESHQESLARVIKKTAAGGFKKQTSWQNLFCQPSFCNEVVFIGAKRR